ncbi:MAG: OsmC family protein [Xanthomonadaceae bacterium]|nr:OsmC family protein [Xanthomonadaceae bacterium]MDP2184262.1 OsmC family protein [Xanthomonadales bacterium]MDZ4114808.1 OsmC family protein [Xanthomonadaceae bacterium]MDZ4377405.1 OsmC family protein [Xanthomonadaceae bacterium]
MSEGAQISISLEQTGDYEFRIRFEGSAVDDLTTDEPAPLGHDNGPNPSRLLLAAVANCLSASLLFALRKFKNQPGALRTTATAHTERDAEGRWRIPRADVVLHLAEPAAQYQNLDRILAQFENFCVVTQSVRAGIAVAVRVCDAKGVTVHEA